MRRVRVVEGQPLDVDPIDAAAVRDRLTRLGTELRPRIPFLAGADAQPVIRNLVGSVQVSNSLILDVEPKTTPDVNWAAALIDLIVDERVHYGGQTRTAQISPRPLLADAMAYLYAEQLDRAVRREGPLAVLQREYVSRQVLAGRLDVTSWLTRRILKPTEFPQTQTLLSVDNPFTSAMAWVAEALAIRTTDATTVGRLRSVAARIRPGLPAHTHIDPGVAFREIPAQWRAYRPAWTTACAVIRRIAPLHRTGVLEGLSLALEPWPLLERLLVRALDEAARQATVEGFAIRAEGHGDHPLVEPLGLDENAVPLARIHTARGVEPDGSLWVPTEFGEKAIATFEAKYSRPNAASFRTHYFQALTTAAALHSPLAVLVYPEASAPVEWQVQGFNGRPGRLVAIGIDMYGYRRGDGDVDRGRRLLDAVRLSSGDLALTS